VNIADLAQRRCENEFIFGALRPADRLLEIGCGNGYLTDELRRRVASVDAFDFSEAMIASARTHFGEHGNRFFVDSVLEGTQVAPPYDAAVCVRVLINLADAEEQALALRNMAKWLKPGGRLILVEGFLDGFEGLNELRGRCGLPPLQPASINFYSHWADLEPVAAALFDIEGEWHSGMFDLLTRVTYPLLVGPEAASGPAEFHMKTLPLALALNPEALKPYGRLRGYILKRRTSA
jgi:SAM-dependent methyltransferase